MIWMFWAIKTLGNYRPLPDTASVNTKLNHMWCLFFNHINLLEGSQERRSIVILNSTLITNSSKEPVSRQRYGSRNNSASTQTRQVETMLSTVFKGKVSWWSASKQTKLKEANYALSLKGVCCFLGSSKRL